MDAPNINRTRIFSRAIPAMLKEMTDDLFSIASLQMSPDIYAALEPVENSLVETTKKLQDEFGKIADSAFDLPGEAKIREIAVADPMAPAVPHGLRSDAIKRMIAAIDVVKKERMRIVLEAVHAIRNSGNIPPLHRKTFFNVDAMIQDFPFLAADILRNGITDSTLAQVAVRIAIYAYNVPSNSSDMNHKSSVEIKTVPPNYVGKVAIAVVNRAEQDFVAFSEQVFNMVNVYGQVTHGIVPVIRISPEMLFPKANTSPSRWLVETEAIDYIHSQLLELTEVMAALGTRWVVLSAVAAVVVHVATFFSQKGITDAIISAFGVPPTFSAPNFDVN